MKPQYTNVNILSVPEINISIIASSAFTKLSLCYSTVQFNLNRGTVNLLS